MKIPTLIFAALLAATTAVQAAEPAKLSLDPGLEKAVRAAAPLCSEATTLKESPFETALPTGMKARIIKVESSLPACAAELVAIATSKGNYYVGRPWFLNQFEGSLEQKLTRFAWEAMRESVKPVVLESRNREGLRRVELRETTEYGSIPIRGVVDESGTIFFLGDFYPLKSDARNEQQAELARLIPHAPSRGPASAKVHLVEFSDFQCPSCKRSASYLKPILEKYAATLHYTRFDLPLMSSHPWAFPAALAGRAIYRQSPDSFWKFKEAVYENQDKLNAFTIAEFARGFADDSGLDLKRYDTDVDSPEVRQQILDGIGAAFTLQFYGTPSFLVNGRLLDAGDHGEALDRYIGELLK